MVVNGPQSLFEFLHKFDPYDNQHFKILEGLIEKYPNFQLIQAYYLKSVQQLKPQSFDKTLSQTAIATYDRELLYEFINSSYNLFSLIIFCEFDLSCQKLASNIF